MIRVHTSILSPMNGNLLCYSRIYSVLLLNPVQEQYALCSEIYPVNSARFYFNAFEQTFPMAFLLPSGRRFLLPSYYLRVNVSYLGDICVEAAGRK